MYISLYIVCVYSNMCIYIYIYIYIYQSALYNIFVHQMHLCGGSLRVCQSTPKKGVPRSRIPRSTSHLLQKSARGARARPGTSPVSVNKQIPLPKPLPWTASAETAIQPLIRCFFEVTVPRVFFSGGVFVSQTPVCCFECARVATIRLTLPTSSRQLLG